MNEDSVRAALRRADFREYGVADAHLIDVQQTTLPDGQRIITVNNAAGLHFTLLPDRGLDIWMARWQGIPLTWVSPGSPHAPDFGQTWLQQFNGGLLTTCGLTHAGPPETDPDTGEQRSLHGRYSRQRAQEVSVEVMREWEDNSHAATITGTVWETSLFGVQLALRRTIQADALGRTIYITDGVTNHGDVEAPLMLLYHLNFGFPVVREGTAMVTASEVYPRDTTARNGFDRWAHYDAPKPEYAEQVFYHRPYACDEQAEAALVNGDFGMHIAWDTTTLPHLTQWKNTRATHYVCGIEPGTCLPEGQNRARAAKRLALLAPGESRSFRVEITVLPDAESVTETQRAIEKLYESEAPVGGYSLDEFRD